MNTVISVMKILDDELELQCFTLDSAEGKAIIGDKPLEKKLTDNCILMVPRENNSQRTI
jgi:hypothetical protein